MRLAEPARRKPWAVSWRRSLRRAPAIAAGGYYFQTESRVRLIRGGTDAGNATSNSEGYLRGRHSRKEDQSFVAASGAAGAGPLYGADPGGTAGSAPDAGVTEGGAGMWDGRLMGTR